MCTSWYIVLKWSATFVCQFPFSRGEKVCYPNNPTLIFATPKLLEKDLFMKILPANQTPAGCIRCIMDHFKLGGNFLFRGLAFGRLKASTTNAYSHIQTLSFYFDQQKQTPHYRSEFCMGVSSDTKV